MISTIDNHKAIGKTYVLEGPKEYTFVEMIEIIENVFGKKVLKIYLPVFFVKTLALLLCFMKSKMLYRDQIPRLLCPKIKGEYCSFDALGIKPRRLEEGINFILEDAVKHSPSIIK